MFRPDMDRFILEIQERPALWDVNSSDYSNKLMKNSAWEEICDLFVPDYSLLDLPEKKQASRFLFDISSDFAVNFNPCMNNNIRLSVCIFFTIQYSLVFLFKEFCDRD